MKTVDFSETIARSFLDPDPMSFIDEDLTFFSQKPLAHFQPNFECKHFAEHMIKMAAMPKNGKNILNSSFQEPLGRF